MPERDYLADWTVGECTWNGMEILVSGGSCGFEGWVGQEEGLAGDKTVLLSLTDTSTGPCQCTGLH